MTCIDSSVVSVCKHLTFAMFIVPKEMRKMGMFLTSAMYIIISSLQIFYKKCLS